MVTKACKLNWSGRVACTSIPHSLCDLSLILFKCLCTNLICSAY